MISALEPGIDKLVPILPVSFHATVRIEENATCASDSLTKCDTKSEWPKATFFQQKAKIIRRPLLASPQLSPTELENLVHTPPAKSIWTHHHTDTQPDTASVLRGSISADFGQLHRISLSKEQIIEKIDSQPAMSCSQMGTTPPSEAERSLGHCLWWKHYLAITILHVSCIFKALRHNSGGEAALQNLQHRRKIPFKYQPTTIVQISSYYAAIDLPMVWP